MIAPLGEGRPRDRGAVLLIALAILALLSLFAVAFVRIVGFERAAAANYSDGVNARLAARAGIQRAIVELQRVAALRPYSDPFVDGWGYWLEPPAGYTLTEPLDFFSTQAPSFRSTHRTARLHANPLVFSGQLGEPYGTGSVLTYRLRILDCASQVNVNHPDPASAERMLRNLMRASGVAAGLAQTVATSRLANRPSQGFGSKQELMGQLMAAGVTDAQVRVIRDRVALDGWQDPDVIRPWNLNGDARAALSPMPRSPVNLNTASVEVLTALFAEVRAVNALGEFTIDFASADRLAKAIVTQRGSPPFAGTTRFVPFRTWTEFETFVDGVPSSIFASATWTRASGGVIDRAPAGGLYDQLMGEIFWFRELDKAITNPNTQLNKYGMQPHHGGYQRAIPRLVDKSDLVDMTTEGCFDAMGVFEISSMGLVFIPEDEKNTTDPSLLAIAQETEQAVMEIYTPFRLTTQEDFEQHRGFGLPGNYIGLRDRTWNYGASLAGLNKGAYFDGPDGPLDGWPGVVSWPEYSLARVGGANHPLGPAHTPASWDGHLTLANMMGVRTTNPDFVTGFARGRLEAFKARAWHELKDEDATGARTVPRPTHPANANELRALATPLTGVNEASPNATQSPRLRARATPTRAGLLNQQPVATGTTTTSPQDLFKDGSSLLNTGVLISPDRVNDAGTPQFLAYDSDNLDLVGGTSIRFWVQPVLDPFARSKEVLFSFVGSQDGSRRQAGFRIYKEALPTGVVNIVLEAVGDVERDSSGINVDWNWASRQGGASTRISIDVTPTAPYANDPLNPQWLPGSWHWVVVNIGPGKLGFNQKSQAFATLQVDKRRSSRQLFYKGNNDVANGLHEYGELHGHAIGTASPYEPLMASNINTNRARCWIRPRLLGDYYHCQGSGTTVTKVTKFNLIGPNAIWFQGNSIPAYPMAIVGSNPGDYVQGPDWPTELPFPVLSYNHRLALEFLPGGGRLYMTRASDGSWSLTFPGSKNNVFGVDGYPGDTEWGISLRAIWDEMHPSKGCTRCSKTPYPASASLISSTEMDSSNPLFGENIPYAMHNSGPTFKRGVAYSTHPLTKFRSWVRAKTSLPHPQGFEPNVPAGPPFGPFPLTYLDDDCHGCEDCDVDGPVFIGGEPAGNRNYTASGALVPVDPSTMASAVFDNVVFLNGDEAKRTDWPGSKRQSGGAVNAATGQAVVYSEPAKDFEDRFFESNLSAFLEDDSSFVGYGAVYHRGFFELDLQQGRLGTVTWTSYAGDALEFEMGVWRIQRPAWNSGGGTALSDPDAPTWGFVDDAGLGITFTGPTDPPVGFEGVSSYFDGQGDDVIPADALVIGLRLIDADGNRGSGQPLPAPLLRSPIFEDMTLTLIRPRPQVYRSQAGVD